MGEAKEWFRSRLVLKDAPAHVEVSISIPVYQGRAKVGLATLEQHALHMQPKARLSSLKDALKRKEEFDTLNDFMRYHFASAAESVSWTHHIQVRRTGDFDLQLSHSNPPKEELQEAVDSISLGDTLEIGYPSLYQTMSDELYEVKSYTGRVTQLSEKVLRLDLGDGNHRSFNLDELRWVSKVAEPIQKFKPYRFRLCLSLELDEVSGEYLALVEIQPFISETLRSSAREDKLQELRNSDAEVFKRMLSLLEEEFDAEAQENNAYRTVAHFIMEHLS